MIWFLFLQNLKSPVAKKIQLKFLENTFLFQDQYEFCYRVVQEYLDAVEIYDTWSDLTIYILKAYIELNETYRLAVGKDEFLEFTFEQQFMQLALLKRWSYSTRLSLAIVNKYTFTCWFACSYHRHHQRKT